MLLDIPDVSYSSSEDDFYDAYEDEEEWSKPRQVEPVPAMRRKYKNRIQAGWVLNDSIWQYLRTNEQGYL